MSKWIRCTLGDLITFQRGFDLPKNKMQEGIFPVVGSNGIIGFHNTYTTDEPSITIGRSGNVGKPFVYYGKTWSHNTTLYVKDYKGNDSIFVFYLLKSLDLGSYAGGSAVPTLNRNHIHDMDIIVPNSVEEQRKIGVFLKKIDDKIELNNSINNNLEQQAMTIYKQCFDSDVNQEWKKGVLSDVADITMGQSPIGTSLNTEGNGTLFFQGRTDFSFRFPNIRLFTTEPKRMAAINEILMSVRAPVGDLNVAHIECCIGRGLAAIRSKLNHQSFIFYTLRFLKRKLDSFNGEGTVFGSINKQALNNFPILIPPAEKIDEFETLVSFMDLTIRNNYNEIHRLNQMRDILLPKLLSGELDVSNIDI